MSPELPGNQQQHGLSINVEPRPPRKQPTPQNPDEVRNGSRAETRKQFVYDLVLTSKPSRYRAAFIKNDAGKDEKAD